MIQVITKRKVIMNVLSSWLSQYGKNSSDEKTLKLKALDLQVAKERDVSDIIGNGSWTEIKCDSCGSKCQKAVSFPLKHTDHYNSIIICLKCIKEANNKLEGVYE